MSAATTATTTPADVSEAVGAAPVTRGRVRVEETQKRIRILFGGQYIADTVNAKLVWEVPYYPTYYVPAADVRTEHLEATDETHRSPSRGTADVLSVTVAGRRAEGAVRWHRESPIDALADHLRFEWSAMDAWFEEDEEVFVHARDPYTRVDIRPSSRHVRVEVDGITVAESSQPRLLFETGLPTRYYLPKTDVRMDLLTPSASQTACPYKGTASYYSLTTPDGTHDDLVWWYSSPVHESAAIAGLVCFYNEKVDIYVDGVLQDRPRTKFA